MPKMETDWSIFDIVKTSKKEANAEVEQQASAPQAMRHKIAISIVPGSVELVPLATTIPMMKDYSIFQVAGATNMTKVSSDMSHDVIYFIHSFIRKKYTSSPGYWNVPVLVNTGTFLVYKASIA